MTPKPVIIEEYNPEWPKMFQEIQSILAFTLGADALSIEHVGSTSVPKLAAKPILDIDVVIESMKSLPAVIAKLETLGYNHQGNLQHNILYLELNPTNKIHNSEVNQ